MKTLKKLIDYFRNKIEHLLTRFFHTSKPEERPTPKPDPEKPTTKPTKLPITSSSEILSLSKAKKKEKRLLNLIWKESMRDEQDTKLIEELSIEKIFLSKAIEYAEIIEDFPIEERN